MIILGDIASPVKSTNDVLTGFFRENQEVFGSKCVIANLEGLLADRNPAEDRQPILWNHPALPAMLKGVIDPVFSLANNHVLDLPGDYDATMDILQREQIPCGGAARSMEEAKRPLVFMEGEQKIILFNFCWNFLLYNHKNPGEGVYVAELDEANLLEQVRSYREMHPAAAIVVYLHWSLDLESLPFPMYRQFSRALVDAGAGLVAGSHAHCVQGGEVYGGGYIVYGLGNFFMPHHVFVNGELAYPDFAGMQLALEWDPVKKAANCHWIEYQYNKGKHTLFYQGSESFEGSVKLKNYSPYQGMTDQAYLNYFKANRRKKVLIPVYSDYRKKWRNGLYTRLLVLRASLARSLAKLKIISWQH